MEVNFSKPAIYSIRVQGKLEEEWSDRLGGMQITQERIGASIITIITGRISDQSALSGILNTLYNLHLPVLSVNILEDH